MGSAALLVISLASLLFGTVVATLVVLYVRVPVGKIRTGLVYHPTGSHSRTRRTVSLSDPSLLKPEALPGYVTATLLHHEDDLFFFHRGVNFREVRARLRAYFFQGMPLYGGSSITQQLAKNILCPEPGVGRLRRWCEKVYELICAIKLERNLSKRDLLVLYLNTTRFGVVELIGFQAASRHLFKKEASDLTLPEAMFLIGLLPQPYINLGTIINLGDLHRFPYRTSFVKLMDLYRMCVNTWGWQVLDQMEEISFRDVVERMVDFNEYQPAKLSQEFELALEMRATQGMAETRQIAADLAERRDPYLLEIFKKIRVTKAKNALLSFVASHHGFAPDLPPQVLNWISLFKLARRHRVLDAVIRGARSSARAEILRAAEDEQTKLVQNHLQFRAILSSATRRLDEAKVPFLLYKGLSLQVQYYGDKFRPCADLDLIVHPADLQQAAEVFSKEGFVPLNRGGRSSNSSGCTVTRADGFEIDLHTRTIDSYISRSTSLDELFSRKIFLDALGCYTLGPSDHLLAIVLHGWKHHWCRLLWILDVALFMRSVPRSVVEEALCQARRLKVERIALIGFGLAAQLFGGEVLRLWYTHPKRTEALPFITFYGERLFSATPNTIKWKARNIVRHLQGFEDVGQALLYLLTRGCNALCALCRVFIG